MVNLLSFIQKLVEKKAVYLDELVSERPLELAKQGEVQALSL